jgi:archaeal flagellin FlaB
MKRIFSRKGMMGVGALIIFIAMVLVAAVAAAVLVSTSSTLQQRSFLTGSQAEQGVSTGVEAISVMATDGSVGSDLENFEVVVRLAPGSGQINLNSTVILFDTAANGMSLDYNGTADSSDSGGAIDTSHYNTFYVKKGPDYQDGYVSRGDIVKMKFKCYDCTSGESGGIEENQKVRLKVVPQAGSSTIIEFTTPDVITDKRVSLWP